MPSESLLSQFWKKQASIGMSGDGRSICISNSVLPVLCLHHVSNTPLVEANASGEILHGPHSCRRCKITYQMADIEKDGESESRNAIYHRRG